MEPETVLALAAESSAVRTLAVDGGFMLVEPTQPVCTAYLFGAGHVARATSAVAAMVGFRVSVADDREAYANRARFRDASEIRVLEHFGNAFSGVSIGREDYIVILTRGHLHDKTVLAQALDTDAGYIGMIGSRKKRGRHLRGAQGRWVFPGGYRPGAFAHWLVHRRRNTGGDCREHRRRDDPASCKFAQRSKLKLKNANRRLPPDDWHFILSFSLQRTHLFQHGETET